VVKVLVFLEILVNPKREEMQLGFERWLHLL